MEGIRWVEYDKHKNPEMKCWRARIMINGKRYKIPEYFIDPITPFMVCAITLDALKE